MAAPRSWAGSNRLSNVHKVVLMRIRSPARARAYRPRQSIAHRVVVRRISHGRRFGVTHAQCDQQAPTRRVTRCRAARSPAVALLPALPDRQRRNPTIGSPEPALDGAAIERESVPEDRPMRGQSRPIGPAVRDDHPGRNRHGIPTPVARDLSGQPPALIHLGHEEVHVNDVGLELDDDERPGAGMPGEDVDDAPLAVDRERHLWIEDPIGKVLGEPARDRFV